MRFIEGKGRLGGSLVQRDLDEEKKEEEKQRMGAGVACDVTSLRSSLHWGNESSFKTFA